LNINKRVQELDNERKKAVDFHEKLLSILAKRQAKQKVEPKLFFLKVGLGQ
jgi:hypothetical protein